MMQTLVLGNVMADGLDILREFSEPTVVPEPVAKRDVLRCVGQADAILHKVGKIDRDVLAAQERLKIIARHGVGLDDLDLECIRARAIPVSITSGANSNAVAEATVGLMLAALRHLPRAQRMIKRDRQWARETLMGRELAHLTVGIVGLGQIGRRVARYVAAFGSRVVVCDPALDTMDECPYPVLGLEELLRTADVISLHCPLTPLTRHLIDADSLARVKRDCVIVNTSRGPIVDANALVTAACEGRIGGAALDVFDAEPPNFDDDLFRCDNIITTPHVAAMTVHAQRDMAVSAANEIRRVLVDGSPPRNDVLS
ncbi:MAG: hydroxyacid dehydrogenase [Gaiellaceae bacterium]